MNVEYPVYKGDAQVGKILVERTGLYYHYTGCVQLELEGLYRIWAISGPKQMNLGVCQPSGGKWITQGKIPCQCLNLDNTQFIVTPHSIKQKETIPIDDHSSFPYLEQLSDCRFAVKDNIPSIVITLFTSR